MPKSRNSRNPKPAQPARKAARKSVTPTKPKRLCSSWILAGFLFVKCGTDENFCCSFVLSQRKTRSKKGSLLFVLRLFGISGPNCFHHFPKMEWYRRVQ